MSLEELRDNTFPFINRDNSQPEYQEDSNAIREKIIEEIGRGEYNKDVYYYGITDQTPDYKSFTKDNKFKISISDNCLYPERYSNELIYIPKESSIHWFVLVKHL